jgi:hypothetical protein
VTAQDLDQLRILTRINLTDIISNLGWEHSNIGKRVAKILFRRPALQFARQIAGFDQNVGQLGLQKAAQQLLPSFIRDYKVEGQENLPPGGPLLIVSNHPGMADTLLLLASCSRTDLRIVAADRPFLQSLPATRRHLIFVPEKAENRMQVVHQINNHFQAGGSILTYPAGEIEPDPAVLPGAVESLDRWSESIALFVRKVPQLMIVGAIISQVLAPQATYHPLTRLRRNKRDQERLGATIQLTMHTFLPDLWPLVARITYSTPLSSASLAGLHKPADITRAVTDHLRPYLTAIRGSS